MDRLLPPGIRARGIHPSASYRDPAKPARFSLTFSWRSRTAPTGLAVSASIGLVFLATPLVSAAVFYARHESALPCLLAFGMLAPIMLVMVAPRVVFLFSRTELVADGERIRVRHRPRRWDFERDVAVDDIEAIRVCSVESPSAAQGPGWMVAATVGGEEIVLVDELASELHAAAVKELLASHARLAATST